MNVKAINDLHYLGYLHKPSEFPDITSSVNFYFLELSYED